MLPPFACHVIDPASGAPIGYLSTTDERILYGDDYYRRADGVNALKRAHWFCAPGHHVPPDSFSPPTSPTGVPVLEVVAFHRDIPRAGYIFHRAALGAEWVRA